MDVLKLKEIRLAVLFRNSGSNGDSRVEKRDVGFYTFVLLLGTISVSVLLIFVL